MRITWTARSSNVKTGDVPTAMVVASLGATVERYGDAAKRSCQAVKCPLFGNGCYAWNSTGGMALSSHAKKAATGADMSFAAILPKVARSARMARITAIGDAGAIPEQAIEAVNAVRRAGLAAVGYTHGWRDIAASLAGYLMASCENGADADRAVDAGWRATTILPSDAPMTGNRTPAGRPIVVCPAQRNDAVTCNTCRLCDAGKAGPVIGFIVHGNQASKADNVART
jgi:hypothetical protein